MLLVLRHVLLSHSRVDDVVVANNHVDHTEKNVRDKHQKRERENQLEPNVDCGETAFPLISANVVNLHT
jgi:hypothetical protein